MKGAIPTLLVCGGLLLIFWPKWKAVGEWWTEMIAKARRRAKEWDQ